MKMHGPLPLVLPLVLPLLLCSCRPATSAMDTSGSDVGTSDGGTADGGTADGGTADGGTADGGTADGGTADGGTSDGGTADKKTAALPAVVVNELMSDNELAATDDLGQSSDWLELYNASDAAVDLSGYGLTDDWTDPLAYVFPDGSSIDAGGYLLLWADGNKKALDAHLPFRLSASGEGVGLFSPSGQAVDWVVFGALPEDVALARMPDGSDDWEELPMGTPGATNQRYTIIEAEVVAAGSTWAYWDGADSPGADWAQRALDDSAWATGPAPLGYGDTMSTTISYGTNSSAKNETAWFRTRFTVAPGEGSLWGGSLSLRVDDGAAVYLDGVELLRQNLPSGDLTADTLASSTVSGDDETSFSTYSVDARTLDEGEAVLAVEVHQAAVTSSDMALDVALTVERLVPE